MSRKLPRVTKACAVCGETFTVEPYRGGAKYCSKQCWSHRHPPESRVCAVCSKQFTTHQPHQFTCSRRCSGEYRGRVYVGPKASAWKDGKSLERERGRLGPQLKAWREAVYKRDGFTCRRCGYQGQELHAHHIKPFAEFPELRFDVSNGETICVPCHGLEHGRDFTNRRRKTCLECGHPTKGRGPYCHSCASIFAHERMGHTRQRTCPQCGQEFKASRTDSIYCSPECVRAAAVTSRAVFCAGCHKPLKRAPSLIARNKTGLWFCSNACRVAHSRSQVQRTCPVCGRSFAVKAYRVKDGQVVTCSPACRYKHIRLRHSQPTSD